MQRYKVLFLSILIFCFAQYGFASMTMDQCSFHDAYHITSGGPEAEGGETDNGGTIMAFVRCTGGSEYFYSNIKDKVKINGQWLRDISGFKWARVWPLGINDGETAVLQIKGIQAPIAENQSVHIEFWSDGGTKLDFNRVLSTPLLRVGSVVPSNDNRTLYIILRNTDTSNWYRINNVHAMGADVTAQCTFVGGTDVQAKGVKVIKVAYPSEWSMYEVKPIPIRIIAQKNGSQQVKVGAFVRWTEPKFMLGTWSGDMYLHSDWLEETREVFQHNYLGPDFREESGELSAQYQIRSMPLPASNQDVIDKRCHPGLYGWFIDDEPELSGRTSTQLFDNQVKWTWWNDWLHPTFINNARNKELQQYGMMVDHPSYDHYCQYAPLVYGGIGTTYSIKNSFWYMDSLKRNCEPLRVWSYCQGVSTTTGWGTQPQDWGIRVQFWNQIMAGTKGIKWFMANHRDGYSHLYDAITQEVKTMNHIRSILLYGDVSDRIYTSHGDMLARLIVGEDACVAIVTNSTGYCTKNLFGYSVGMTELWDQDMSFDVPGHINIQQVKEVTENGLTNPNYNLSWQWITFNDLDLTYSRPYRVFLIGKNDTTAPDTPREVNVARINGSTATLVWDDAYDNYGIHDYRIVRDFGITLGNSRYPVFKIQNYSPDSIYQVIAKDAAGNESIPSQLVRDGAPIYGFDDENNFEGWKNIRNVYRSRVAPWGVMYYWTQAASQPNLYSPMVRINTGSKKHVRFRYYNGTSATQGCLYWSQDGTNFNGSQWFSLTQNQWTWIDLDLTSNPNWSGTTVQFRLDLPAYGQQDWQVAYLDYFDVY